MIMEVGQTMYNSQQEEQSTNTSPSTDDNVIDTDFTD